MDNINTVIILIFITACIVILFFKYRESFSSIIETSKFITKDLSGMNVIETTPLDFQEEINDIVDQVLTEINRLYRKQLIRINIERAEKTHVKDEHYTYEVYVFVFNSGKESTAKLNMKFDVVDTKVKVNSVDVMGSRESIFKQREGADTRGSSVIKYKVDMSKVKNISEIPLEFSLVNYKETPNKMVDRNRWILHKERELVGNVKTFPSKTVKMEWDDFGVELTNESTNDSNLGGLNHGTRPFTFVPNFYKGNFQICNGSYLWLFDTAKDVVSRPLGVS